MSEVIPPFNDFITYIPEDIEERLIKEVEIDSNESFHDPRDHCSLVKENKTFCRGLRKALIAIN